MRKNNPAVYECPRTKNKLHHWMKGSDGLAVCKRCKLKLNQEDTDDVYRE